MSSLDLRHFRLLEGLTDLQMGAIAPLTRVLTVTVNFALTDLKNRGWIEADRHHIRLKDPDALRHIA